jgi:hypothetical protein
MPAMNASGVEKASDISWQSRWYLMEGVYYLINEEDGNRAEELFRKAILSSSFDSLSKKPNDSSRGRRVVAEAFYFLGKIHYERAISGKDVSHNVAWAKKYLLNAEEQGIYYDRLHPPLLEEMERRYPGIDIPASESENGAATVVVETDDVSYKVNSVKVDRRSEVTEREFPANENIQVESGARYKMKPDIQSGYKSVYGVLSILGVGLAIWLVRG